MRAFEFKKAYWAARQDALPAGYRRVEYLESTGVQWIDTGVIIGNSVLDADMKLNIPNTDLRNWVFGAGSDYGSKGGGAFLGSYTRKWSLLRPGLSYGAMSDINGLSKNIHWNVTNITSTISGDLSQVVIDNQTFSATSQFRRASICLFCAGGTKYIGDPNFANLASFYELKIQTDGALVRSFVPCVRISDNKPGMYDLCGSVCPLTGTSFYVNAGTGDDFTWGELS